MEEFDLSLVKYAIPAYYVIASAEADTYEKTRCISGEVWEKDFLKVADYEIPPIQAVGSDDGF